MNRGSKGLGQKQFVSNGIMSNRLYLLNTIQWKVSNRYYLWKIPMKNTYAKYLWKSTYEKCLSMTHIDEISIMKNTFRKMVCV